MRKNINTIAERIKVSSIIITLWNLFFVLLNSLYFSFKDSAFYNWYLDIQPSSFFIFLIISNIIIWLSIFYLSKEN